MTTAFGQSIAPHRPLTPPPDIPRLTLEVSQPISAPVPNRSLPFCPTGPPINRGEDGLSTPPETPPSKESTLKSFSLLKSARAHPTVSDQPLVYSTCFADLVAALDEIASELFPDPRHTFPWLHGLHDENQMQLAFFAARRGFQREVPKCFNWVTIVKCGGDMSSGCLRGAVSPDEILELSSQDDMSFLDVDPKQGFGIRNFQIQIAKIARVTDIVIYRDQSESLESAHELAKLCATAQRTWRQENDFDRDEFAPVYSTFVLSG